MADDVKKSIIRQVVGYGIEKDDSDKKIKFIMDKDGVKKIVTNEIGEFVEKIGVDIDEEEERQKPELYPVEIGAGHVERFEQATTSCGEAHLPEEYGDAVNKQNDKVEGIDKAV